MVAIHHPRNISFLKFFWTAIFSRYIVHFTVEEVIYDNFKNGHSWANAFMWLIIIPYVV